MVVVKMLQVLRFASDWFSASLE